MKISKITMYPQEELIRRLREVTLTDGVTKPYAESEIEIRPIFSSLFYWDIAFAQQYILESDYNKISNLDTNLKPFGFAINDIKSFWEISSDTGEIFSYIPPIIEYTKEDRYYISDGMHRLRYFCKKHTDYPCIILIKNPSVPYYAIPCNVNLDTVPIVKKRPKVRKIYRDPDNYKALFRDYNSQFPGIQRDRSKDK